MEQAASQSPPLGLGKALQNRIAPLGLIAEVKRASPSAGEINARVDPVKQAESYQEHGASAISVLTDRDYFHGSLDDLIAVKRAVSIPVLRKEFIVDPFQIAESRAAGADAILLIVAAMRDRDQMAMLMQEASRFGMDCLIEAHDEEELAFALDCKATIIGINNRNLKTFEVSLETSRRLLPLLPPDTIKTAESGIKSVLDAVAMREAGADAILVGEALMRGNPSELIPALTLIA